MKGDKKRASIVVRKEDHEKWKGYAGDTGQSVSELVRRSVDRLVGGSSLESGVDRIGSKLDIVLHHLGVQSKELDF